MGHTFCCLVQESVKKKSITQPPKGSVRYSKKGKPLGDSLTYYQSFQKSEKYSDHLDEFFTPRESMNQIQAISSRTSKRFWKPNEPIEEVKESVCRSINNPLFEPARVPSKSLIGDPNNDSSTDDSQPVQINQNLEHHEQTNTTTKEFQHDQLQEEEQLEEIEEEPSPKDDNKNIDRTSDLKCVLINQADRLVISILNLHEGSYDEYDLIYQEKKESHKLRMYMQSYMKTDKHRINKTRAEWYVACTPEQFIKFMNNITEQKKLDHSMDQFNEIESFNNTDERMYVIMYLSYKKMFVGSARDFIYLKHYRKINDHTWCDASTSITYEDIPEYKDKIRGNIILSGHIASNETNDMNGKSITKVKLYSECDFKANVPMFLAKSFTVDQTKKYIEKCIKRISELYHVNLN